MHTREAKWMKPFYFLAVVRAGGEVVSSGFSESFLSKPTGFRTALRIGLMISSDWWVGRVTLIG